MTISQDTRLTAEDFDRLAWEYYETLPLEHFMESTPQSIQREIVLASLAVIKSLRGDFHYFNELLIQYIYRGVLRRVVPDNMLLHGEDDVARRSSWAVPIEERLPLIVFEYVSESSEGKDYNESYRKYEEELGVPYCLMFHADRQRLDVFRHDGGQYVRLEPNAEGRIAIEELEIEAGILERWVRFWHRGKLVPLPGELRKQVDELETSNRLLEKSNRTLEKSNRTLLESNEELSRQMVRLLQQLVIEKAKAAGNDELAARAADSRDEAELRRWLAEL